MVVNECLELFDRTNRVAAFKAGTQASGQATSPELAGIYVVKDGHFFLSLMADGGIYEFETIKKSNR